MSLVLPDRANLEFLKSLAKERLAMLRLANPKARLADAQREVASQYGFGSWRALKAEVEERRTPHKAAFVDACRTGDLDRLRALLAARPELVRERVAGGSTGLHLAVPHPEAVRLLIENGADVNVRDVADNASPLHIAAGAGAVASARLLLEAGADARGDGDVHGGGCIGWAAMHCHEPMVALLLRHGASHDIFSAVAMEDIATIERLVEGDAGVLRQRRPPIDGGPTPLHAAVAPPDGTAGVSSPAVVRRLIELGADVHATDGKGRSPLVVATLRGNEEVADLLRAAGAEPPDRQSDSDWRDRMHEAATSVRQLVPMVRVADMRRTVEWYRALGFKVSDEYLDGTELVFASVAFGGTRFTLSPGGAGRPDASLWFLTDRVNELYALFRERQLRPRHASGEAAEPMVPFDEDLYEPFYGGRQFSVRDLNGLSLVFWQPPWLTA